MKNGRKFGKQWGSTSAGVAVLLAALLSGASGCRSSRPKAAEEDHQFFTSGSREADQRASQRMAKAEQLAPKEENVKKAEPGDQSKSDKPQAAQAEKKLTLYDRLGGEQRINEIVDDFTPRVLDDPRVNWERKGVTSGNFLFHRTAPHWEPTSENVAALKKHMVQFLSLSTGGPAYYDGRDIKPVHATMHISNPEFDAAVGDLKATLDRLKVPNAEQKELLAIIESTRPQIVTVR